jgi:hypothetical protein
MPPLASGGMVLSGLRNFVHTLHAELGPENIYAGALVIGALIEGGPAHRNASAWGGEEHLAVVPAEDREGANFLVMTRMTGVRGRTGGRRGSRAEGCRSAGCRLVFAGRG